MQEQKAGLSRNTQEKETRQKGAEREGSVVEVCAGSLGDCMAAFRGGADRIELNGALSVGGLTPTASVLSLAKEAVPLPVICMVRPRAGGFCYDSLEKKVMFAEALELLERGADGLAFGFLKEDRRIERESTKRMIDLIHSFHREAVFHRAFDVSPDPYEALETLLELGADRVLTSGCSSTAFEGRKLLRELQNRYGDRIELLAGSGVNEKNARALMEETGIRQVHSSCKSFLPDPTAGAGAVSYAYLAPPHETEYEAASEQSVRRLTEAVKEKGVYSF